MSASLLAALTRRAANVQLQLDAEPRQLLSLSNDELACVLHHLALAHDIACVASTCRGFRDAARLALAVRSWSGEVSSSFTSLHSHIGQPSSFSLKPYSQCIVHFTRGQTVTGSRHLPAVTFFTPAHFTMHCAPGGGRAGREPRCRV